MANKRAQLVWSITIVAVLASWLVFGYYTWTSTVITPQQEGSNKPAILPHIRVEENTTSKGRAVAVYLSLTNAGTQRLKLLDTVSLTPLYDIKLSVKAEGSDNFEPAQPSTKSLSEMRNAATSKFVFDPQKDAVVELIPGSALTRSIILSSLYDLQREGQYELTLAYQPESVTKTNSDNALVGAFTQRMSFVYTFSIPMKPAELKDDKGPKTPPEKAIKPPEKP